MTTFKDFLDESLDPKSKTLHALVNINLQLLPWYLL
jgi:hypothetical protein